MMLKRVSLYLLLSLFCFSAAVQAGHLDDIHRQLKIRGKHLEASLVKQFQTNYVGVSQQLDQLLPGPLGATDQALLTNLIIYTVMMETATPEELSSASTRMAEFVAKHLAAIDSKRKAKPPLTSRQRIFEIFYLLDAYRTGRLREGRTLRGDNFGAALNNFFEIAQTPDQTFTAVPFLDNSPDVPLEALEENLNAVFLLIMLSGSSHMSANVQMILAGIRHLSQHLQRLLSRRLYELLVLPRRRAVIQALQAWLQTQIENGASSEQVMQQLLANGTTDEGLQQTLTNLLPDVSWDGLPPVAPVPPSVFFDGVEDKKQPLPKKYPKVGDAEKAMNDQTAGLKRTEKEAYERYEKQAQELRDEGFDHSVPKDKKEVFVKLQNTLGQLKSGHVLGEPEAQYDELISHVDRLEQEYWTQTRSDKFKSKIQQAKSEASKEDFIRNQRAYRAELERRADQSWVQGREDLMQRIMIEFERLLFRVQRGDVLVEGELKALVSDYRMLRGDTKFSPGLIPGWQEWLPEERRRDTKRLCRFCQDITTDNGDFSDRRLDFWERVPEGYRVFAQKLLRYIIEHYKYLPEVVGQEGGAEQQTADHSLLTTSALLSESFNRLQLDMIIEGSVLPPGLTREGVVGDDYCFYHALAQGMNLPVTGQELSSQIIVLVHNILQEGPGLVGLLNEILEPAMASVESIAAMAFVDFSGVQMWGHVGMLPLISWWFGVPVLVTTPATWEGAGAVLFLDDGTWDFQVTEQGAGGQMVQNLMEAYPNLVIIENDADLHWSLLRSRRGR